MYGYGVRMHLRLADVECVLHDSMRALLVCRFCSTQLSRTVLGSAYA